MIHCHLKIHTAFTTYIQPIPPSFISKQMFRALKFVSTIVDIALNLRAKIFDRLEFFFQPRCLRKYFPTPIYCLLLNFTL